jgi:ERCC4-type nuclease
MIAAVTIDSREPEWIQKLQFGGVPTTTACMETGDLWAACDDGSMLIVERKTPDDFLGTLKDDRLFPQLTRLASLRGPGFWPYLMITGELQLVPGRHVITERGQTGWDWAAVQGAILSAQEMGVFATFCAGDIDYEAAIIRLATRDRRPEMLVQPKREARILGQQAAFIAGLPGIGLEKVKAVMDYTGTPAWALVALTDADSQIPGIGPGIKNNVRYVLGLQEKQQMVVLTDDEGREVMAVAELGAQ